MRKITELILHCAATPEGKDYRAADIDKWHKMRGWTGIGYNFVIDLDGKIEAGRDLELVPAHCLGHNKNSIGICYVGGCDKNMKAKDTRTDAQKKSMAKLVKDLMKKYNIPIDHVYAHYQFCPNKACPSVKIEQLRADILNY